MDTKKMKQLAMFFLAASLLVTLSACGSRNPAAMEQTVWEDPVPSIRGNIENGVYTNQWLNLKKNTSTDPAFLEEYNRVSCLADPQRSRWCELYEYDKDGNSVILTTEKLPQDTTLSQAAEAYVKSFRNKFEDTAEGVKISTQAGSPDTNYIFHSYTCTLYRIQITSSCEGTVVERKNADLLFWEKDGYLVELQITDNDTVSANDLFPDGSSSNDTPSDSVPPDDAPSDDASSSNDPATVPATAPMNEVPYTTSLSASIAIYSKPDSTSSFVQNVGQDGIYTIVEEAYDAEGNLWGKLKSGLGWVLLKESSTVSVRTCPQCNKTEPNVVFMEDWKAGDICFGCSRDNLHGGEEAKQYCSQCGADCTYRGLEEDGRCEDCYFGDSNSPNTSRNSVGNTSQQPASCSHSYTDATCIKPQTCTKCGAISGAALGHTYSNATCTTPQTCKTCGATAGSAAGHKWKSATCTHPETCSVCNLTQGDALGHNMGLTKCSRCDHTDYSTVAKSYSKVTAYDSKTGEDLEVINVSVSSAGILSFTFNGNTYSITIKERVYDSMTCFDCYQNGSKLSNAECRIGNASYYNMLHFEWDGVDGHRLYFCTEKQ